MRNIRKSAFVILLTLFLILPACGGSSKLGPENDGTGPANNTGEAGTNISAEPPQTELGDGEEESSQAAEPIDLEKVRPNEVGKIMVVMFHNFVTEYVSGDKEYTTTFDEFSRLLQTLYDMDYRLVSLTDYLDNNISTPAGCIPVIFTFDDGTAGQFKLVNSAAGLVASRDSAVGIMEEFYKIHPDFGLEGTFFVNLGNGTFNGEGSLSERLQYLIGRGFEIGNHTFSHAKLTEIKSAEALQEEIGGNQQKMLELVPGYTMSAFSLPYGLPSKELQSYVVKGEYQGVGYEHRAIMEVGWDPAFSPVSLKFNPLSTHRVRASGIKPVEADLAWWLEKLSREEQYVSDGDPDTVTVPASKEEAVDKGKLGDKKLVIY